MSATIKLKKITDHPQEEASPGQKSKDQESINHAFPMNAVQAEKKIMPEMKEMVTDKKEKSIKAVYHPVLLNPPHQSS